MQEVAQECERLGGKALAVPTDVSDEAAVRALAHRTVESFGRLDVWVNNAGVSAFGRFEQVPAEAFRRVIDINLFGCIHGARAALPYFRQQGNGILINVSSVVAITGQPYTTPYTLSKYAIRGLSDSLRMELYLENNPDIHVCTVLPASIDTPIFQHAANYTGRKIKPLSPIYPPTDVAKAIAGLIEKPQREIIVGQAGYLLALEKILTPDLEERTLARQVDRDHFQDYKPASPTDGNLFEPMQDYTGISGNWLGISKITTQDIWDLARQAAKILGIPIY